MEKKELIEFALEKEVMSRRMYEDVAERCGNDEARMMLLQLAGYEAEHIKIFTRALSNEIAALNFDTEGYLSDCGTKPFHLSDTFDEKALTESSLEEVLTAARNFEKMMAEFYGKLSEDSDDPTVTSMGQRLSKEEMGHFEYVARVQETLGITPETHDEEFHAH